VENQRITFLLALMMNELRLGWEMFGS